MDNRLDEYAFLWNDSDPGWVVHQHDEARMRVTATFLGSAPTAADVAALRRAVPAFRERTASQVHSELRDCSAVDLGDYGAAEAVPMVLALQREGLRVHIDDRNERSCLLVNEVRQCGLVIEDDDLATRVAEACIAQGVPVVRITA